MPEPNYDEELDFASLAIQDREFASVLGAKGKLNFHDPKAVQCAVLPAYLVYSTPKKLIYRKTINQKLTEA